MPLSEPSVLTANFEEVRQHARTLENWKAGMTGPVKLVQNAPLPIQVIQTGLCNRDQIAGVLASRGDATQLTTDLNARLLGKLGPCWKMDAWLKAIQTGDQKVANSTKRIRYWIHWCQDSYSAPVVT